MIVDILMKEGGQVVGLIDSENIAGEYAWRYWGLATGALRSYQNDIREFYRSNPEISHYCNYGGRIGLSLEFGPSCGSAMQVWEHVREFLDCNKAEKRKLYAFTLPLGI